MNKKVFISSTFADLSEYRESVRKGLRQLGLEDISMENFGARDERPKEECIKVIREEADFFVGIYAHRYGFIPDGNSISITQSEYMAAEQAGIPKLIYVIDDEYAWSPILIDDGELKAKLLQFKKELYSKHICKTFTNQDNLNASVLADIGRTLAIVKAHNPVGSKIPVRDIITVSERVPSKKPVKHWTERRKEIYDDNRGIFITHIIKPSKKEGQLYDVFIYLIRHKSDDFSDVRYAEFFLGPYWGNKVFPAKEENKGFIGISTSAYGTMLCTCKVTFEDFYQIEIHRYIDFEAERMIEFNRLN